MEREDGQKNLKGPATMPWEWGKEIKKGKKK